MTLEIQACRRGESVTIDRKLAAAVLRVGDGRGFVVEHAGSRYVITAAHCLPRMPPATAAADISDTTFKKLLSPLGKPAVVWAMCLFADPVADLAVLGVPDGQAGLYAEANEFDRLVGVSAFRIGGMASYDENIRGRVLSLYGEWLPCNVTYLGGPLWISERSKPGMSGSPIIDDSGKAIGVIATGSESCEAISPHLDGPNPCLAANLPGWLLRTRHGGPGVRLAKPKAKRK